MTARIEAVAFDIDGTLVDSEPLHLDVLKQVCSETGVDLAGLADDHFHGVHLDDVWHGLAPRRPSTLTHASWTARIIDVYCARAHELAPLAGMEALLDALEATGLRMVCVSNSGRRVVDANIAALGIAGRMEFTISFDDVTNGKPHPEPYASAAQRLGLAGAPARRIEKQRRLHVFERRLAGQQ